VPIEDAGFGVNLLQDLKHSRAPGTLCPISVRPEGDKRKRMAAQKIETGRVYLPADAPWLGEFLSELWPSARPTLGCAAAAWANAGQRTT
jgi:phage terminase large subunit-like protein